MINSANTADKYLGLPGGVSLTLSPDNPDPAKRTVYSIQNFHGDTAMTVDENGAPTSSVYLYEPFGQPSSSATFGTNSNPANATDQSMGWAANPTRKVAGAFTIPIIQMGARVYLPTAARFLQTDPIEGGTPNAYVYPADPINASDYSGLLSVRNSSSGNIRLTVTYNYGMQYGWGGNSLQSSSTVAKHIQPTASARRVQGPGSARSNTGRTSGPETVTKKQTSIPVLGRITSAVSGGGGVFISKVTWKEDTLQVYPTLLGRYGPWTARGLAWSEVVSLAPEANTSSMMDQFFCHWDFVRIRAPRKESWNLDFNRPDTSYWSNVINQCNP